MSTVSPEIAALNPDLFAQATGFKWITSEGVDEAPDRMIGVVDGTGQIINADDITGVSINIGGELHEEFELLRFSADLCVALIVADLPGSVDVGLAWEVTISDGYGNAVGERTGVGVLGMPPAWLTVTVTVIDLTLVGDEGDELVISGLGSDGAIVSFAWPRDEVVAMAADLDGGVIARAVVSIDPSQFRSATNPALA